MITKHFLNVICRIEIILLGLCAHELFFKNSIGENLQPFIAIADTLLKRKKILESNRLKIQNKHTTKTNNAMQGQNISS